MTLSAVRGELAAAVTSAVADIQWIVTSTIPLVPDSPAAWVRFPNDVRRNTLSGGLAYQIRVTFCVSLNDVELAQEALNDVYEPALWEAIEAYSSSAWSDIVVVQLDEPYQITLADGSQMLAVDMPIDLNT
jgi:hypothetical protein